jgi:hypothetical protein
MAGGVACQPKPKIDTCRHRTQSLHLGLNTVAATFLLAGQHFLSVSHFITGIGTLIQSQHSIHFCFTTSFQTDAARCCSARSARKRGHVECKIDWLWKRPNAAEGYQTPVFLHGHTCYSQESLHFISDMASKVGPLRWLLAMKERAAIRESQIKLDFDRAYWTPPLTPSAAFEIESRQITEQLRLRSIVSLSDHDNIHAPLLLRIYRDTADMPISTELTVP